MQNTTKLKTHQNKNAKKFNDTKTQSITGPNKTNIQMQQATRKYKTQQNAKHNKIHNK